MKMKPYLRYGPLPERFIQHSDIHGVEAAWEKLPAEYLDMARSLFRQLDVMPGDVIEITALRAST